MNTLKIKCIQANFIMGNQKLYRLHVHMWYSITCTTPQQTVYREGSNKQLLTYALNKHISIKLWKYQNLLHAGELLLS